MRKLISSATLTSGIAGTIFAVFFGFFQLRIVWATHHGGGLMLMDWSPYIFYLMLALNWWIPLSLMVMGATMCFAEWRPWSGAFAIGWCLHAWSAVFLVGLGMWVFTGPLEGARGAWWMWWQW